VALPQQTGLGAGPLSLRALEDLCEHLTAEERAKLRWSPHQIRDAVLRFVEQPDDQALERATHSVAEMMMDLGPVFLRRLAHVDLFRTEMDIAWRTDLERIRSYLSPASADAAEWATRAWFVIVEDALSSYPQDLAPTTVANPPAEILPFVLLQTLLIAITESMQRGTETERIGELAFRAYEAANHLVTLLRRSGIKVDPFRGEPSEDRVARMRRYAEHVRASITDDDIATLDDARLGELR
jgi:hypothetical protein